MLTAGAPNLDALQTYAKKAGTNQTKLRMGM